LVQEVLLAGRLLHDAERWRWPPYSFFCLFFVAALTDVILIQVPALPCDMYRCPFFGEQVLYLTDVFCMELSTSTGFASWWYIKMFWIWRASQISIE